MAFRASVRPSAEFRNNAEANHLGLAGTPASAGRKLPDLHRSQDPDTGRPDGIALRRAASVEIKSQLCGAQKQDFAVPRIAGEFPFNQAAI